MTDLGFLFWGSNCDLRASHIFSFLGLMIFHNAIGSCHTQSPIGVSCKSKNYPADYQHCRMQPGGVYDLDCFIKHGSTSLLNCEWKPGNHTSEKSYVLITKQRNRCSLFSAIAETSKQFTPFMSPDITVEVFENRESSNCTKTVFTNQLKNLLRCEAPNNATFRRRSGRLDVQVSWQKQHSRAFKPFAVRYWPASGPSGNKTLVQCHDRRCEVKSLNTSLVYLVQIQCVISDQCSQCLWSNIYTVPAELTVKPVITQREEKEVSEKSGTRIFSLAWMLPSRELYDGYMVTVWRSGEAVIESLSTTEPRITLILSYSTFHLNISTFNKVSVSPPASLTVPHRAADTRSDALNVTVHSKTSFTVHWRDNLMNAVCYAVEWRTNNHKPAYFSFYRNTNDITLSSFKEPLEHYRRYAMMLHTRKENETCNLKYFNGSESTYGTTQFYFLEGAPIAAPKNISSHNVTMESMVLQWLAISEEDARGFLLGYVIHYTEYNLESKAERNVTVDPQQNTQQLMGLKSDTVYKVQMSGFTRAGAGPRSPPSLFQTNKHSNFHRYGILATITVVLIFMIAGYVLKKRALSVLWPTIPDPAKSCTMQRIEELELLSSIKILMVEEWDANSLQIVKEQHVAPADMLPQALLPPLNNQDDDSSQASSAGIHGDSGDVTGDFSPDVPPETCLDSPWKNLPNPHCAFPSDYTTMELFQQGMTVNANLGPSVRDKTEYLHSTSEPSDYVKNT